MKQQLIAPNAKANKLIIFFNGWSMSPAAVDHLALPSDCHLLHLWDYREADHAIPTGYQEYFVVAWSMGVWAAQCYLTSSLSPMIKKIAIAGTPYPMHNQWGIPENIFRGTLHMLTDTNREKFNRRMCGGKSLAHLRQVLSLRSTKEIKEELKTVYDIQKNGLPQVPWVSWWDVAVIGAEDRIIPPENQKEYWQIAHTRTVWFPQGSHYLFSLFESWEQILTL